MSETLIIAIMNNAVAILSVLFSSFVTIAAIRKINEAKRREQAYLDALDDIAYLLAVEVEHCRTNRELSGDSRRNLARKVASVEHRWSGKHSASKVAKKREAIKSKQGRFSWVMPWLRFIG